jgi:ribonuclease HI
MENKVEVFTDGSSRGNPGPGGYGIVLKFGDKEKEVSKGFRLTTNNRMELLAVIEALSLIKSNQYPIHVYSDSKYVIESITQKWVWNWEKKGFNTLHYTLGSTFIIIGLKGTPVIRKTNAAMPWR